MCPFISGYSRKLNYSSSYLRCPRRLEDTLDGTSEAGLLVTEVITWSQKTINYLDKIAFLGVNDISIKIDMLGKRLHAKKSGTLATDVQS